MTTLSRFVAAFARMAEDLFVHPGERGRFAVDLATTRTRSAGDPPVPVRIRLQIDGRPSRTLATAYIEDPATDRTDVAQVLRKLADSIEAPQAEWAIVPTADADEEPALDGAPATDDTEEPTR